AHPGHILLRAPEELCVFAWITLVVFADAALCDLDDATSDAAFGTRTLANTLPARRLWLVALLTQILGAPLAVWGAALAQSRSPALAAWWAIAPPASLALIRLANPRRVRDIIDARLALLALGAVLVGRLVR